MNRVGRYEIVEPLGQGSMGSIYRAKDVVLDRHVALKILSTEGVRDSELRERFCREARACAKLRHPNIITVYDFGQTEDHAFIAMELLEGSDLRRMMASGQSLTLQEKLQIMAAVCDGLEHAHAMGIVHRDLKPSNIFIGTDGQPRILDFGVAHMPASSLTMAGRVLGTPQYMSPEQILGQSCDGRSDIFSVAITAFELIAGQHPFGTSAVDRIAKGRPNSLLSINPAFPATLNEVLAKGLAREPEHRYQSAAEFATALRNVANNTNATLDSPPRPAAGTQTILSAVLVNLQKFEEAADHGDLDGARHALAGMRQAGAQDTRYAVALKRSAERLAQLEKETPAVEYEVKREVAPLVPRAIPQSLPVRNTDHQWESSAVFTTPARTAIVRPQTVPIQQPSTQVRRSSLRWTIPAVLLSLAVAAVLAWFWSKERSETLPASTPVAVAEVITSAAPLFAKPDSGEPAITVAHRGEKLKILRAPRFREQQWTEIQNPLPSHTAQPLFARTADLGNWSGADISLARQLQQMFAPSSYTALDPADTVAPASTANQNQP